jgi:hypothetical protein
VSPLNAEADARRAERLRVVTNAQQFYNAGDGGRTLDAVESALRIYPRDPELEGLLRRLRDDAERRVDLGEARASGALAATASESMAFRRAQDRKGQAKSAAAGDIPSRIRALWAAAELFEVAATERPAVGGDAAERGRGAEPPREVSIAPAAPPESVKSAPATPPVSSSAPAPETTASLPIAPPSAEEERGAIERTLNEYRSAYEALDIRRVLRVYPSLSNADTLARAFGDAREVRIGFSRPTITLTAANTATATFNRTQEFVPKVGKSSPPDKRTLTVQFRKDQMGIWMITGMK